MFMMQVKEFLFFTITLRFFLCCWWKRRRRFNMYAGWKYGYKPIDIYSYRRLPSSSFRFFLSSAYCLSCVMREMLANLNILEYDFTFRVDMYSLLARLHTLSSLQKFSVLFRLYVRFIKFLWKEYYLIVGLILSGKLSIVSDSRLYLEGQGNEHIAMVPIF